MQSNTTSHDTFWAEFTLNEIFKENPKNSRPLLRPPVKVSPSQFPLSTLVTPAFLSCGRRSLAHWCSADEQTEKAVIGLKQDQRRARLSFSNKFELSLNSRREDHSSVFGPNLCVEASNPSDQSLLQRISGLTILYKSKTK